MFVVDTNVFLYAANEDYPEYKCCRKLLQGWREGLTPWYVTWGILYEFLRVTTHPRVFQTPWTLKASWQFIESLLASPGIRILQETDRHAQVAKEIVSEYKTLRGSILHDIHVVILMREHGIEQIYTRDSDFYRFKFLKVKDPLSEA